MMFSYLVRLVLFICTSMEEYPEILVFYYLTVDIIPLDSGDLLADCKYITLGFW